MARHAVVDLAQIYDTPPLLTQPERLPPEDFASLVKTLQNAGVPLSQGTEFQSKLTELRRLYEPYVNALAGYLLVSLPAWCRHGDPPDNWQTSAWERRSSGAAHRRLFDGAEDDHEG